VSTVTVSTREAAHALGVSIRTVQRRAANGQIDAVKVGERGLKCYHVAAALMASAVRSKAA